ncbi:YceD family protein [Polymorphum gilvum]|uniref:DUF177 domain-containing protein n=1 Tax=Polymorphum gilvum (strain LMG 25793 / CGMCC 1.9160 / SL003B-26A1) TaxID=991905 RepID=F2IWM8_POLGS|nr:DUF177 domain-containing protein [Polymorphum gilvum]ADZ70353.1 hypothetical protein SL003B_1927 [Polymorphum gilvum SL003B-26A1]
MTDAGFPYSHRFDVAKLGNRSQSLVLAPTESQRARIAEAYGLEALPALTAELEIRPWRKAGVFVSGRLRARVVQVCVVTLEPFEAGIDERLERAYLPDAGDGEPDEEGEIEIDLEAPEPPDLIEHGIIDLGALICEHLALTLDPFPRRPGAELESPEPDEEASEAERPSPFKVLEKLKRPNKD